MRPQCPVCGGPLPEKPPKPRGRPAIYCTRVCGERARQRRKRAAGLLEYADSVEACVGRPGFGAEWYLRGRAEGLRARARELLASIGELEAGERERRESEA